MLLGIHSRFFRYPTTWLATAFCLSLVMILAPYQHVLAQTTITVTTTTDELNTDGDCSLREAIQAANTNTAVDACPAGSGSGQDVITLPAGTYTLAISGINESNNLTGDLNILSSMTINGAGAAGTIIDGNGIDRVFHIPTGFVVTFNLNDVTVTGGNQFGGGLLLYQATATVNRTIFTNNTAIFGSALRLQETGTLNILNSTISNNTDNGNNGAAAVVSAGSGTLNIINTTVSGNSAPVPSQHGGGAVIISPYSSGSTKIRNSTFVNNSSASVTAGVSSYVAVVDIQNSIFHNNTPSSCGRASGGTGSFTGSNNLMNNSGLCSSITVGAVTNLDASLATNGGSTPTYALLTGSNAINAGTGSCPDQAGMPLTTDQRGISRPQETACDIGSYEFVPLSLEPDLTIPNTPLDASNGSFSVPVNFTGNGADIASVGFSIDYDETCLSFDETDSDTDGMPDAITGLPNGFQTTISHNSADSSGELDLSLFDSTTPIGTLRDGPLFTLALTVKPACITTDGSSRDVTINFAASPAPSFGNPGAVDVAGTATGATIALHFNATPTAINLSANTVDENAATGTSVGTLSTTDPNAGDSHTYALVTGVGDTDNSSFTIDGDTLKTAAGFDFETKNSLSVRIRTTDNGGPNGSFEQSLTISVNDLYEAPTGIDFGGSGANGGGDDGDPVTLDINENATAGSTVATFGPANPDNGSSYTFALVDGEGSTDNGSFTFVDNALQILAPPDAEGQSSYTIRVRITDDQGNSVEQIFTVTINNINEAPVAVNDPDDIYAAIFVGGQTTTIDLLANDTDVEGDTLSVASVDTTGTQGSVTNNGNNVSYTAPNANGSSSFTYQASDSALNSNSATATVTYVKNDPRGDCNANGSVTAADFVATVLEIFDSGDGQYNSKPAWWLVYMGGYAGSARGCDSNASENGAGHSTESVNAADIICTVLLFFGQPCNGASVTAAGVQQSAQITVADTTAAPGQAVAVSVRLNTADNSIAAATLALELDASKVSVDPTDSDGDGVPDAVTINAPAGMSKSASWNAAESRLEVALFGTALPLPTLADGSLLTVTLTVAEGAAAGATPLQLQLVSLGDPEGQDVQVTTQPGTLTIEAISGSEQSGAIFLPLIRN